MGEQSVGLQNQPVDVSGEFGRQENHFFVADSAVSLDAASGEGSILWRGMALRQRVSYHQLTLQLEDYRVWEDVPPGEYEEDQSLPFWVSPVAPGTLRLRIAARPASGTPPPSPMLVSEPRGRDPSWEAEDLGDRVVWRGPRGSLALRRSPLGFEFRDASGRLLTRTNHLSDSRAVVNTLQTPLCFVRNASNLHRHLAASLALAPGERLYGGGESFTRLDKRGQRLVLWAYDAYSAQTPRMYKPVPFLLSSRGYALFVHTSAPLTLDVGRSYDAANVVYLGDDVLDLFFFFGSPREVLSSYTELTGRSPLPPLWSFGLWMGRESYRSEGEVREVARRLRQSGVPCDVLHLDTGWTEKPFHNDFRFSPTRFPEPERMISELGKDGFRLSLWQFPYLHPNDALHKEAVDRGYAVLSANGKPPVDDAVIDLSNPEAERWYKGLLARLLRKGVAAFTADFGEAAPLSGLYHTRQGGFHEHNLYPLRYNAAVAGAMREAGGGSVQWARSGWAGSQRYPLHWSGDPEPTYSAMAATLRAGLSLGLCGFSFWGHFIGGFSAPSPPELYLRWLAFGALCSHTRCHGHPPTEPWEYGEGFTGRFRRVVELRYALLPYVYAQAALCAGRGHPMIRPLFFAYPQDNTSWLVEDEYLFGEDLLVAPLFSGEEEREVYLPPGGWVSYFSGEPREGGRWHRLAAGEVPAVVLARDGAAIPHAAPAQHTGLTDWGRLEIAAFLTGRKASAEGHVLLPDGQEPLPLRVELGEEGLLLAEDPLEGRVEWTVRRIGG